MTRAELDKLVRARLEWEDDFGIDDRSGAFLRYNDLLHDAADELMSLAAEALERREVDEKMLAIAAEEAEPLTDEQIKRILMKVREAWSST